MKVGFIGLGHMGAGMAANLLKAGHEVSVYNRTPGKTAPLAELGAHVATTIAEACQGEAVMTMLANDEAVESVAYGEAGLLASLRPGGLHVSSSTIGIALAERLTASHASANQHFVAAPVFGRPDAAAAGQLFVAAAGAEAALAIAAPLLAAIGKQTFVMSEQPSRANLVKLSGNFLIASVIESLGEALALVGKGGVDKQLYLDLLTSTLFGAPVYKTYGKLNDARSVEEACAWLRPGEQLAVLSDRALIALLARLPARAEPLAEAEPVAVPAAQGTTALPQAGDQRP